MNHELIEKKMRDGNYIPGIIRTHEIVNGHGKQRIISCLNVTDRFITRLLSQKMKRYIEPVFLSKSFAYQDNKGILQAVLQAKEFLENGNEIVVEIDLKNYFDSIQLDKMYKLISENISDSAVNSLIKSYLYCKMEVENQVIDKKIGLVQGNPISPILSNLYLHSFDTYMEQQNLNWIRFADNIYIFLRDKKMAIDIYSSFCTKLKEEYNLHINQKKSGIKNAFDITMLGYIFYKVNGIIEIRKKQYETRGIYTKWEQSTVQKTEREYHIVQDGILNKKDYALLFENEEEKHHIPAGIIHNINMYGNITIASGVLSLLRNQGISINFFDKYGNLMGRFIPEKYGFYSEALLKQCELYINETGRLTLAKKMEIAGIHNMRANLKYYEKKGVVSEKRVNILSEEIVKINEGMSIGEIMLIEARVKQNYYASFNEILKNNKEFYFTQRTKRPPKDEINAMISFGNTLLYNQFLQIIVKSSLDPRIGVVHATNRRQNSLNLDFADIFKPLIVDRVIFLLINLKQIKADHHFIKNDDGSVLLNKQGKRIFIEKFEEKLATKIVLKNKTITYKKIMVDEVHLFQKYILHGEKYKPYKYY